MTAALPGQLPPGRRIPLGSAKANIGHTLEAAGLAGVVKTVLTLQHGVVPPLAGCRRLNPQIDWEKAPLFAPTTALEWPAPADGLPRRAGVNAFGIGGMNVHVVLDEFRPDRPRAARVLDDASSLTAAPLLRTKEEATAVVGMGTVFPGAKNIDAYWELLNSGRDPKSEAPPERWIADLFHQPGVRLPGVVPNKLGGFVRDFQYDWRRRQIPPKQIASANPLQFIILQAVEEAFARAGIDVCRADGRRTGVVVGAAFTGDFASQLAMGIHLPAFHKTLAEIMRKHGCPDEQILPLADAYEEVFLKHMPALLDETGGFTSRRWRPGSPRPSISWAAPSPWTPGSLPQPPPWTAALTSWRAGPRT